MRRLEGLARGAADALVGLLLAALFGTFVLQIAFRYLLNWPVGWTVEVCLTLWLWLVLLGAALCVPDREHVRFDALEQRLSPRARRIAGIFVAGALLAGFLAVLGPSWDYVTFYRIKRSATLRIPLSWVFSVFLIFALALVLRQLWTIARLLRTPVSDGAPPLAER
ncbi:MAG: TRAP transporter small permease subunit [Geminicoccaceae bacterium]|nr:TRAP transporter small permease [Geminicoccaceae bacterium]MDW8125155.1 TRAP transporter small permease subunit [Geminicoccaceae bacterium]